MKAILIQRIRYLLLATVLAATVSALTPRAIAQNNQNGGRQRQRQGNFDPAQFQQRMLDRYRERLEITDDAEWRAVQPFIQKVMDTRMAAGSGGRGTFGNGNRRGGDGNNASDSGQNRNSARTNPAADQLSKAIDGKAPSAELKAALAKYVEYRKTKQAELELAQNALRSVFTARQEAIATLSGLL